MKTPNKGSTNIQSGGKDPMVGFLSSCVMRNRHDSWRSSYRITGFRRHDMLQSPAPGHWGGAWWPLFLVSPDRCAGTYPTLFPVSDSALSGPFRGDCRIGRVRRPRHGSHSSLGKCNVLEFFDGIPVCAPAKPRLRSQRRIREYPH